MRATVYLNGNIAEFHLFHMPELCEKYCRRHGLSLEAFLKCQRKILNDSLAEGAPPPIKRAYVQHDADYALPMTKWPDVPQQTHADVYEFYKAIGWSYVRKKFR